MESFGSFRRKFAPWNDPAAKPFISFENVTKIFGDFTAVDDLSLNVFNREFSRCSARPAAARPR